MTAKIIQFPALHLNRPHDPEGWKSKPREFWTKRDAVEEARSRIEDAKEAKRRIDAGELRGLPQKESLGIIAKAAVLELWKQILAEREAEAVGTMLEHNGVRYAETAGRA